MEYDGPQPFGPGLSLHDLFAQRLVDLASVSRQR